MLLNRERAVVTMTKYDLDGLVASTRENVVYLSNLENALVFITGGTAYAILPRRNDVAPTLVISRIAVANIVGYPTWMPEIRTFGTFWWSDPEGATLTPLEKQFRETYNRTKYYPITDGLQVLAETLKDLGMSEMRLGFDDIRAGQKLQQAVGLTNLKPVEAIDIFREIRAVKTDEEIGRLRKAAQINERSVQAVIESTKVGVDLLDVFRIQEVTFVEGGGIPLFSSSNAGQEASQLFPPSWGLCKPERKGKWLLKKGDVIRYDFGGMYYHYCADTGFTVSLGDPSKKVRTYFNALRTGMDEAEHALRPGIKTGDLFKLIVETIRKSGIPHFERHHCGHSIGIEMYEGQYISPQSDVTLEAGMVFNVEVPYYELGFGSVHIEDTFLIVSGGMEKLTPMRRELFIKG